MARPVVPVSTPAVCSHLPQAMFESMYAWSCWLAGLAISAMAFSYFDVAQWHRATPPSTRTLPTMMQMVIGSLPDGSVRVVSWLKQYRYRLLSPASNPIGSWLTHRPV